MNLNPVILLSGILFFTSLLFAGETAPIKAAPKGTSNCDLCKNDGPIILTGLSETKWLEPKDRVALKVMDSEFTNQDGVKIRFDQLKMPAAITFLYTRCENPNKCPLAASRIAKLQGELESAGSSETTGLYVVTYDPEYDRPNVLKAYASERGIRSNSNVMMLRPEPTEKTSFFESLNVTVNFDKDRVNITACSYCFWIKKDGSYAITTH